MRSTLEMNMYSNDPNPTRCVYDYRVFKRARRKLAKHANRKGKPEHFRAAAIWAALAKCCDTGLRGKPLTVIADYHECIRSDIMRDRWAFINLLEWGAPVPKPDFTIRLLG